MVMPAGCRPAPRSWRAPRFALILKQLAGNEAPHNPDRGRLSGAEAFVCGLGGDQVCKALQGGDNMLNPTRRQTLALGASGLIAGLIGPHGAARAAGDTLTIAYNVNLPSFDPTVGPSAVNPTIQAIYRSVFDQYIGQTPQLTFEPGLLTAWGWTDDKSKIWMDVRPGVTWHDGSPFTPADIVW